MRGHQSHVGTSSVQAVPVNPTSATPVELRLRTVEATLPVNDGEKAKGRVVTAAKSPEPGPSALPARTSTQPKTVVSTNTTATAIGKPADPGLGKNRKPKRPLDPTNPFAEP
jgi:hypothetical protein